MKRLAVAEKYKRGEGSSSKGMGALFVSRFYGIMGYILYAGASFDDYKGTNKGIYVWTGTVPGRVYPCRAL
jgi:hypothetical protein